MDHAAQAGGIAAPAVAVPAKLLPAVRQFPAEAYGMMHKHPSPAERVYAQMHLIYDGKAQRAAMRAGWNAKIHGTAKRAGNPYTARSFRDAWFAGFDAANPARWRRAPKPDTGMWEKGK